MSPPGVLVDGVTVTRDRRTILASVSIEASPGEVIGIVGPNGAGKSTLLRVLAGDITPNEGRSSLMRVDVATARLLRLAQLRAYVGPQHMSDVVFCVREVVAMGLHPFHSGRSDDVDRDSLVTGAMERVDVAHLARRPLKTLSSGEQQRVQLARGVAQRTPVILLDEPTSALDVGHQEMVMNVLRELADEGTTVVAVLHDLNLAAAHTDRVVLLDAGQARSVGTPTEVLTGPMLSAAYREPMEVIDHPFRGCPLILTRGS